MNTIKDKLNQIRSTGYPLDFSETFNHTFEIYKKIAVNAGLVIIIVAVVAIAVIFGMIGAIIGFAALSEGLTDFNPAEIPTIYIVGYVLFVAALSGLLAPFTAGLIKMAKHADADEPFSLGTAFDCYSGPHFKELFVAAFLIALLTFGITTLCDVLGIILVGPIISVISSFLTLLTIPLIIFGDLKAIDAIGNSVMLVCKNPLIILGLLVVTFIASLVGFIAFCIGYFFTAPILYALYYSIYKRAVGVQENSEIDQIGM